MRVLIDVVFRVCANSYDWIKWQIVLHYAHCCIHEYCVKDVDVSVCMIRVPFPLHLSAYMYKLMKWFIWVTNKYIYFQHDLRHFQYRCWYVIVKWKCINDFLKSWEAQLFDTEERTLIPFIKVKNRSLNFQLFSLNFQLFALFSRFMHWFSNFILWISNFILWISNFNLWITNFILWISNFNLWITN